MNLPCGEHTYAPAESEFNRQLSTMRSKESY